MQFNCGNAIDMDLLNGARISSSYFQLSWVWSIVILTLLLNCMTKDFIDVLFTVPCNFCQPAISRTFKNMSQMNARAPVTLLSVVATVTHMV
jgi:hypothetical protein